MVNTVHQLVDTLGGIKEFASIVGTSLPPIYRAREMNHIPFKWRPAVYQEVKRRAIDVAPELLGFEAAQ